MCGTGIGVSAYAANKVARRALRALHGPGTMARLTREHNDANMLALGAQDQWAAELARGIVKAWLETDFSNGQRHIDRIAKITEYGESKIKSRWIFDSMD